MSYVGFTDRRFLSWIFTCSKQHQDVCKCYTFCMQMLLIAIILMKYGASCHTGHVYFCLVTNLKVLSTNKQLNITTVIDGASCHHTGYSSHIKSYLKTFQHNVNNKWGWKIMKQQKCRSKHTCIWLTQILLINTLNKMHVTTCPDLTFIYFLIPKISYI